jgi:hypothetical protein
VQRPASALTRAPWPAVFLLAGALLLLVAIVQAGTIPRAANDDYGALMRAQGGSAAHFPTHPDAYRQIAAQSRMLQNAYLGLTGVALVTVGAFGVAVVGSRDLPKA